MVELGLKDAGYTYINIDDCWAIGRDQSTGKLIPDPAIFPSGMKAVSDYVHSRGFKFGIYTDRGPFT
jgi:alpha-galactosidase